MTPGRILKTYVALTLLSTFASSFIWESTRSSWVLRDAAVPARAPWKEWLLRDRRRRRCPRGGGADCRWLDRPLDGEGLPTSDLGAALRHSGQRVHARADGPDRELLDRPRPARRLGGHFRGNHPDPAGLAERSHALRATGHGPFLRQSAELVGRRRRAAGAGEGRGRLGLRGLVPRRRSDRGAGGPPRASCPGSARSVRPDRGPRVVSSAADRREIADRFAFDQLSPSRVHVCDESDDDHHPKTKLARLAAGVGPGDSRVLHARPGGAGG